MKSICCIIVAQLLSCVQLCDPRDCSTPGSPSFSISQSLLKFMSIVVVMLSNHLILCSPFLFLFSSPFPFLRHHSIFNTSICYSELLQLLLFSHQVVSDSSPPHGLQHSRPPGPSPSPRVCPNSCPMNWWCHPTIASFVTLFSFSLSQHQGLFQ